MTLLVEGNRLPGGVGSSPHEATTSVLLVDDDPVLRELVRVELQDAGFQVHEAQDVHDAQQMVRFERPDVALVDVLLPGESGLELTAWLRGQPWAAHLPIIVLTGLEHDEVIELAFDAGATDFIRKPVEPRLLRHRVQLVLRARRQRRALERREAELDEAQAIARIGSFSLDVGSQVLQHSAELAGLLGWPRRAGVLRSTDLLSAIDPADRVQAGAADALGWVGGAAGEHASVLRLLRQGEMPRWVQLRLRFGAGPDGSPRIQGTLQDITEQRSRQQRIEYLATHDMETGLPNTVGFTRMATASMSQAGTHHLIQVGIDRANLLLGRLGSNRTAQLLRAIGDRLLRSGEWLQGAEEPLPVPEVVARTSATGFALLYRGLQDDAAARAVAERTMALLAEPLRVADVELRVQARAGIARAPEDGDSVAALLRSAEAALQHAARHGARVRFHERVLSEDADRHLWLERELARALEAGSLDLAFQPKFAGDGHVAGVEALARWDHPKTGAISPADFIPVAEESGLIHPMGAWVLRAALTQAARWMQHGRALPVAVNLSAVQVLEPGVADLVADELERAGVPGELLELEITESVLLADRDEVRKTLRALAATGARIALDDFGTGYSSLSYLTDLPLDVLKIDRSFVDGLSRPETVAVVRAIIALADGLDLQTIAEGVETDAQARWLRDAGCDLLQGFFLARPVTAGEIDELLHDVTTATAALVDS